MTPKSTKTVEDRPVPEIGCIIRGAKMFTHPTISNGTEITYYVRVAYSSVTQLWQADFTGFLLFLDREPKITESIKVVSIGANRKHGRAVVIS